MRRILRPFVFAVLALGLALGASVGFATPAAATTDPSFTASIVARELPVYNDSDAALDFGGLKSASSTITGADVSIVGGTTCDGAAGATSWSCEFRPGDGYSNGNQTATIHEINADGTHVENVLPFDVYSEGYEGAVPFATAPVVSYSFVPGGVNITTQSGSLENDPYASTQTYISGERWSAGPTCPGDINYYDPFGTAPAADQTCTLTYGDGELVAAQSQQGDEEAEFDMNNALFYVPSNDIESPITALANATTKTVTITGKAGANDFYQSVVEVIDQNNVPLCEATDLGPDPLNSDDEDWTCTTSALSVGSHALSAVVVDTATEAGDIDDINPYDVYITGGMSSATPIGTITIPAPNAPTVPVTTPGLITPVWSFTVSGDLNNLHPGDTITVTGQGLPAGTTLDVVLHSTPTDLGTVVAAPDGTFTQTDTIPQGIDIGPHTIIVTATGPDLVTTTQNQAITVTSPPASGSGGKTAPIAPKPTVTKDNGGSANGQGIQPNILTKALTPIADVAAHPNKIVAAFEIGLVLLILAVLPAQLLDATIAEQSDRFERRFGKLRAPNWLFRLGVWFRSAPAAGAIIVTLVTAILFGFADPKFGFTLASLRLVLAAGIALILVRYVANALTGLIARVQWNIVAAVSTRPYGLILTLAGVIVSRALHFAPGFLIGLVLGLTIQGKSAAAFAWRTVVLRTSIMLLMAIAAWIGYSTLTLGGNEGGTFWSALVVETLVAITTESVVALLVELLPLRFLEGERVYAHSRVLWGIFYLLTVVVFVLAVIPWEGNWDALHGSLWIWIVVLGAFAVVCVGIYIYFRRFAKPLEEEPGSEKVALGETVSGDKS